MKSILFTILTIISLNSYSQMIADSLALKHKIVSVQKQVFFDGKDNPSMTYTEFLDAKGLMEVETSWSNNLNKMLSRKYCFYDNKNQLVKIQTYYYSQQDSSLSTETFEYNELGLYKNNEFGPIDYQYNEAGLLIKKTEQTAKPYQDVTTYAYDKAGRLIKTENFFYSGLSSRTTFEYNSAGQLKKEIVSYFGADKINPTAQYEHVYKYDQRGLLTTHYQKQTINKRSEKLETRVYRYTYEFAK